MCEDVVCLHANCYIKHNENVHPEVYGSSSETSASS